MSKEKKTIRVLVYKSPQNGEGSGHEGKYVEYEIPYKEKMTVLNVCDYIYENNDRSLSFYYSCRIGKCLGCLVDIDGKAKLACTTLAKDSMKIGPHKKFKVIKDLLVDTKV